jgi:hypothetical protein
MSAREVKLIPVLGVILILLGVLALAGQFLQIRVGDIVWPFFIIAPGVLLFIFAIGIESELGEPLAMLSGILTSLGLLLLYQSVTGHWASWAYAWALMTPTGVGLGQMLYGRIKQKESAIKTGTSLVNIGIIMFLVGLVFFEIVLNISGFGLGFIGWPILFIGLGLFFLVRGLFRPRGSN